MPESQRDDPPAAIDLPATFGKYFLTEKLATGGMAEIYLGKIVGPGGFEKQLVIKQIHPRLSGQRHFVDLFVAEAKILVTLAHGNIVPVYELGVIDDTYFIAMEYIDGPTLYRLTEALRRRDARMAPAVAAWITARILEGLDYAHRKGEGVIHRDLSPRNVMLSRDGEVKLVDFGIAVTLGDGAGGDAGESAPTGSFPYMSPEQVRKQPLTGQTDLFSAGVLLWEMLVGHRLFARSDADATLRAVTDGDIARPSIANPEVPARLDEVAMRALERDPATRWPTSGDMLAALQRYLYSLDETPGPRDVAALVARYCPPETRRLPTHHDELDADGAPEATRPRPWTASPVAGEPPRPGPATAVIPRDRAPQGKRGNRARTETFATHVELVQLLERPPAASAGPDDQTAVPDAPDKRGDATPVRPIAAHDAPATEPAVDAAGAGASNVGRPSRAARADDMTSAEPAVGSPGSLDPPAAPTLQLPGRTAPPTGLLLLAAIGALALGGGALFAFYQGRAAVLRPDAAPRRDTTELPDAATAPSTASPADAGGLPDAAEPDAPPVGAAGPARPLPVDAGASHLAPRPPRPDARTAELTAPPDAAPRPAGTATLTVGAAPWGAVLLDGKPIGRTPIDHLSISAGHHVVSVTFGGEDPPRTQSFPVDLAPGDARDLFADFGHP
ncbi:MAG TPA: protein kinase [Kofleriaceae bacterium]|jgi:tRNA A-37 threonylcarbamoyl transferase component Bud32|nr:protein kinase [Kofleriaceae bacterium]